EKGNDHHEGLGCAVRLRRHSDGVEPAALRRRPRPAVPGVPSPRRQLLHRDRLLAEAARRGPCVAEVRGAAADAARHDLPCAQRSAADRHDADGAVTERDEHEILTLEEVAGYLRLTPQTIYKWAQEKRIPAVKLG